MRKFIIFLIFCMPMIDTLNGFLIRNGYLSIAKIIKPILLFLMFVYTITYLNKEKVLILFSTFLMSILIMFHGIFIYTSSGDLIIDIDWLIKYMFWVISFYFFYIFKIDIDTIYRLANFYFFIYFLNLILGISGIGFPQYKDSGERGIGSVGFIYAGNELSITLILLEIIILSIILYKKQYMRLYIYILLFIIAALLKATKTFFLSAFLVPIIILLSFSFSRGKHLFNLKIYKTNLYILLSYAFASVLLFPIAVYILLFYVGLINRIEYWLGKLDLITFLLSSRNLFAEKLINYMFENLSFATLLFGYGRPSLKELKSAEIDLIDFIFAYGLVGVGLIIFNLFIWIYKISKTDSRFKYIGLATVFYMFIISNLSGHVLYSSMGAIVFGFLISLIRTCIV